MNAAVNSKLQAVNTLQASSVQFSSGWFLHFMSAQLSYFVAGPLAQWIRACDSRLSFHKVIRSTRVGVIFSFSEILFTASIG